MQASFPKNIEYQFFKLIQDSRFSSLYQVEKQGKFYALKQLRPNAPREFFQEADSLAKLQSPHIVKLIENHLSEKDPYFVLEWVEGESLEKSPVPKMFSQILKVFQQTVESLATLHEQSLIHGDLKGSNILCGEFGIKMIDLGLAKESFQSGSLHLSGTPAYLAPELFFSHPPHPASDFYALGMMMQRWLSGKYPFSEDSLQDVLRWHLFESPTNPHSVCDIISLSFGDYILKLLSKNPGDRPQSAGEILIYLREEFGLDTKVLPQISASSEEESYEIFGEAIHFYERQKALSPSDKWVLAELYYRQGYLQKALELLDFENAEVFVLKMKILTRMGLFSKAEEQQFLFQKNNEEISIKTKIAFLNAKGVLEFYEGKTELALSSFFQSEEMVSKTSDWALLAVISNNLGNVLFEKEKHVEALQYYQKGIEYAKRAGDRIHEGMFLMSLGYYYHQIQKLSDARLNYEQSIKTLRSVGQKTEMARALLNLANLCLEENEYVHAKSALQEAQEIFRKRKLNYLCAYSLLIEGDILFKQNSKEKALEVFEKAELDLRHVQRPQDALWAQLHQVECLLDLNEIRNAKIIFASLEQDPLTKNDARLTRHLQEIERKFSMENFSSSTSSIGLFEKELQDLQTELVGELDIHRLVEKILDRMITLTRAERGFVVLNEAGEPRVALARNMEQGELSESESQMSESIAKEVMKKGEPLLTVDALEDERFSVVTSIHHLKLRSILCLPFKHQQEVLGVIYLDNRERAGAFHPSLVKGLKPFVEMMGQILLNARRFFEVEQNLQATQKKLNEAELQLQLKYDYANIVGRHPKMREVFSMLDRVTDVEVPVVLLGESGVGKELLARAIHNNGPRAKRTFVSMNCQAIPESLFESELFGHVRGSFTGAVSDRMGLVEQAHRGTLFLDEIGDMPLALQGKLLRVLQEGKFRRLGDREERPVDLRIISATHRDLKKMIQEGSFREDLWFRISVVEIHIPSLRERLEDVPLLVDHFLDSFAKTHQSKKKKLSAEALNLLMAYDWPGNVRELENSITNACVFSEDEKMGPQAFRYKRELTGSQEIGNEKTAATFMEDFSKYSYREAIQEFEKRLIVSALKKSEGNATRASHLLKIARPQLSRMIKKYKVKM